MIGLHSVCVCRGVRMLLRHTAEHSLSSASLLNSFRLCLVSALAGEQPARFEDISRTLPPGKDYLRFNFMLIMLVMIMMVRERERENGTSQTAFIGIRTCSSDVTTSVDTYVSLLSSSVKNNFGRFLPVV